VELSANMVAYNHS